MDQQQQQQQDINNNFNSDDKPPSAIKKSALSRESSGISKRVKYSDGAFAGGDPALGHGGDGATPATPVGAVDSPLRNESSFGGASADSYDDHNGFGTSLKRSRTASVSSNPGDDIIAFNDGDGDGSRSSVSGGSDDDSLSVGTGTGTSRSTNTNDVLSKTKYCFGLSFTTIVIILTAIPVAWVLGLTIAPLAVATRAEFLLVDHEGEIAAMLGIANELQHERHALSAFLDAAPGSAQAAAALGTQQEYAEKFNAHTAALTQSLLASDHDARDVLVAGLLNISDTMSRVRTQVRSRQYPGGGPALRTATLDMTEGVYSSLLTFSSGDSRGAPFFAWMILFTRLRHVQNCAEMMWTTADALFARAAAATTPSSSPSSTSDDHLDYAMLFALKKSIDHDVLLLKKSRDPSALHELSLWQHDAEAQSFFTVIDTMLASRNSTVWAASLSLAALDTSAAHLMKLLEGAHAEEIDHETGVLVAVAVKQGMLMLGAVLCCVGITAVIIYLNNREQLALERALVGAHKLSKSVQKFVPRQALKTMGVRSVTQVEQGLFTEVALALLFCDLRSYTTTCSRLTPTELYDYVQDYINFCTIQVTKNRGVVQNYLGDAVFASFNSATDCALCGRDLQVAVEKQNLESVAKGKNEIVQIGVGMNYGVVVIGIFGADSRLSVSTVSMAVNIASRAEGLCKTYGARIIATESIVENLNHELFHIRRLGRVKVCGAKDNDVQSIYDIFDADPLPLKLFKSETRERFESAVALLESENPQGAVEEFAKIASDAKLRMLVDRAAEKLSDAEAVAASLTPGTNYLSWEKDGSARASSKGSPNASFVLDRQRSMRSNSNSYNHFDQNTGDNSLLVTADNSVKFGGGGFGGGFADFSSDGQPNTTVAQTFVRGRGWSRSRSASDSFTDGKKAAMKMGGHNAGGGGGRDSPSNSSNNDNKSSGSSDNNGGDGAQRGGGSGSDSQPVSSILPGGWHNDGSNRGSYTDDDDDDDYSNDDNQNDLLPHVVDGADTSVTTNSINTQLHQQQRPRMSADNVATAAAASPPLPSVYTNSNKIASSRPPMSPVVNNGRRGRWQRRNDNNAPSGGGINNFSSSLPGISEIDMLDRNSGGGQNFSESHSSKTLPPVDSPVLRQQQQLFEQRLAGDGDADKSRSGGGSTGGAGGAAGASASAPTREGSMQSRAQMSGHARAGMSGSSDLSSSSGAASAVRYRQRRFGLASAVSDDAIDEHQ